ncbi:MAG: prepilin-type N-terminal cleavage/methylation domain-containing protein [Candidatus Thiodiazotropha sp.]|jgi:general secretion pathway protein J
MRSESGFTLLELIISLVLMSLIVMLLFSGLDLGRRAWEKTGALGERQTQERLAFDYLRRTLSELLPERQVIEKDAVPLFDGEPAAIRWVGPTASKAGIGGASLFQLQLRNQSQKKILLLRRWLYHPEVLSESLADGWDWRRFETGEWSASNNESAEIRYSEHLLISGLSDLEITYYGSRERAIPPEWHHEWRDTDRLPRLIRIRFIYPEGASPPLSIQIRAAQ